MEGEPHRCCDGRDDFEVQDGPCNVRQEELREVCQKHSRKRILAKTNRAGEDRSRGDRPSKVVSRHSISIHLEVVFAVVPVLITLSENERRERISTCAGPDRSVRPAGILRLHKWLGLLRQQ